jgi:hypothetical protein
MENHLDLAAWSRLDSNEPDFPGVIMNTKYFRLFFLAGLLAFQCAGASTKNRLEFHLPEQTPGLGDTFQVEVGGRDFTTPIDAGGLDFRFDPKIVQVLSVDVDSSVWDWSLPEKTHIDNQQGWVGDLDFGTVFLDSPRDDFNIARIVLRAVGKGCSLLEFMASADTEFGSGYEKVNVNFVSASVNVNVNVIPLPPTYLMWVFAWAVLQGFPRRQAYPSEGERQS